MSARRKTNGGVTLFDVARAAGVHPSTVSRALDPQQKERVKEPTRRMIIDTATRLGYRPDMVARGLRSGRTATVGVVVADLGNPFVTPIIHGLTGAIEAAGMLPMIAETQDDHARLAVILDHMLSRRVDAIVVAAARSGDKAILESAGKLVPLVVAARPLAGTHLPQAIHDDRAGGELAARHLGDLGHVRVAQLNGPEDVANFPRRADGFSSYCRAQGMVEIELGVWADAPDMDEGRRLMSILLERNGVMPTGIFVHNDSMAMGALAVVQESGLRVPDDLSIIGYNDLAMVGFVDPPLTTIHYPSLEVGWASGEMVRAMLLGEHPEDRCLDPSLVVRSSTQAVQVSNQPRST
jgi:LacI family transcriptional regulator